MRSPPQLALTLMVALTACNPAAPTMETIAGSYSAIALTTQEAGVTTDQLARGSLLNLVLIAADSTTTGRLFVPDGAEDGGDFDADLEGTWVLHGDTVEFDHDADTFVRDVPFVFEDDRLPAERTFGTTTVRVVLAKQ